MASARPGTGAATPRPPRGALAVLRAGAQHGLLPALSAPLRLPAFEGPRRLGAGGSAGRPGLAASAKAGAGGAARDPAGAGAGHVRPGALGLRSGRPWLRPGRVRAAIQQRLPAAAACPDARPGTGHVRLRLRQLHGARLSAGRAEPHLLPRPGAGPRGPVSSLPDAPRAAFRPSGSPKGYQGL